MSAVGSSRTTDDVSSRSLVQGEEAIGLWRTAWRSIPAVRICSRAGWNKVVLTIDRCPTRACQPIIQERLHIYKLTIETKQRSRQIDWNVSWPTRLFRKPFFRNQSPSIQCLVHGTTHRSFQYFQQPSDRSVSLFVLRDWRVQESAKHNLWNLRSPQNNTSHGS